MNLDAPIAEGRTAEIFAWGNGQILKLYRRGFWAGDVTHEASNARAVHAAGISTPVMIDLIEVNGRTGLVYERVDGPTMLMELLSSPEKVVPYTQMLAELHAAMHSRTISDLPNLKGRLQWKIQHAQALPGEWKSMVLAHLDRLPDGKAICHGDFHPDNIIMTDEGPIIMDWVDATRGYPLADVARTLLLVGEGALPPDTDPLVAHQINDIRRQFIEVYLTRYGELNPFDPAELEAWKLPVAAARLEESIAEEEEQHLAFISSFM